MNRPTIAAVLCFVVLTLSGAGVVACSGTSGSSRQATGTVPEPLSTDTYSLSGSGVKITYYHADRHDGKGTFSNQRPDVAIIAHNQLNVSGICDATYALGSYKDMSLEDARDLGENCQMIEDMTLHNYADSPTCMNDMQTIFGAVPKDASFRTAVTYGDIRRICGDTSAGSNNDTLSYVDVMAQK